MQFEIATFNCDSVTSFINGDIMLILATDIISKPHYYLKIWDIFDLFASARKYSFTMGKMFFVTIEITFILSLTYFKSLKRLFVL